MKHLLAVIIAAALPLAAGCGGAGANSQSQQNSNAQNCGQNSQSAPPAGQALEFDVFQFLDGYNYMMGSQCD